MPVVSGRSRVNRPYFFREVDGSRMEIPAFGVGSGDLEGIQLALFKMYAKVRQIDDLTGSIPPDPGEMTFDGDQMVFDGDEMEFN